jgi:hypothetical protein
MSDEMVSVIEIAKSLGMRKQSIYKIISKLKINTINEKSEYSRSKGQKIGYISKEDEKIIIEYIKTRENIVTDNEIDFNNAGYFYIIQLEPEYDPNRFKVGFAMSVEERIKQHKTSAPLLKLLKVWPCKLLWEKTVIDCVTNDCEKIYTEVFRCSSIDDIIEKCDSFFELMPKI